MFQEVSKNGKKGESKVNRYKKKTRPQKGAFWSFLRCKLPTEFSPQKVLDIKDTANSGTFSLDEGALAWEGTGRDPPSEGTKVKNEMLTCRTISLDFQSYLLRRCFR